MSILSMRTVNAENKEFQGRAVIFCIEVDEISELQDEEIIFELFLKDELSKNCLLKLYSKIVPSTEERLSLSWFLDNNYGIKTFFYMKVCYD